MRQKTLYMFSVLPLRCLSSLSQSSLPALLTLAHAAVHSNTFSYSSNSNSSSKTVLQQTPEENLFVGAYTPVTRQLWQDRLRLAQQQGSKQTSAAAGATQLQDAEQPRAPKQTVIRYPFTTDRVLLELVSTARTLQP